MAVRVTGSECKNGQTIPLPPKGHIDPIRECKALSTMPDIVQYLMSTSFINYIQQI